MAAGAAGGTAPTLNDIALKNGMLYNPDRPADQNPRILAAGGLTFYYQPHSRYRAGEAIILDRKTYKLQSGYTNTQPHIVPRSLANKIGCILHYEGGGCPGACCYSSSITTWIS